MARSRRRGGRRRRWSRRSLAREGAIGAVGLAVAGVVVAGPLLDGDREPAARSGTAAAPAPAPEAGTARREGDAPVAAAESETKVGGDDAPSLDTAEVEAPEAGAQPPETGEKPAEADDKAEKSDKADKAKEDEASGTSQHTDARAADYLRRDRDKAAERVRDVRSVGGYLRIYTDLPQSAGNSKHAIELCERGLKYLVEEQGVANPVVFVQAEFGMNGNPVLANVLGPDDGSCRLTRPRPGG